MLQNTDLSNFNGTENYYKHLSGYLYTDGVHYVAKEGQAYWLIDEILFTVKTKKEFQEFSVWKLKVNEDKSATLTCEDGNYNILYQKKIGWTTFPIDKIEMWFENGVLILPSEH